MENQYGITVANKYNLFLVDNSEDVVDILERTKTVKAEKKASPSTAAVSKKQAKSKQTSDKSEPCAVVPETAAVQTIVSVKTDSLTSSSARKDDSKFSSMLHVL